MLRPQIIVFERESRIAPLLRELAASERWVLREPKQRDLCWQHLQQITATVFVVVLDTQPEDKLELIQRVSAECPRVAIIGVGSVENAETLAGLTWDMGADYALFPPLARDLLPEVARSLMGRLLKWPGPPAAADGPGSES